MLELDRALVNPHSDKMSQVKVLCAPNHQCCVKVHQNAMQREHVIICATYAVCFFVSGVACSCFKDRDALFCNSEVIENVTADISAVQAVGPEGYDLKDALDLSSVTLGSSVKRLVIKGLIKHCFSLEKFPELVYVSFLDNKIALLEAGMFSKTRLEKLFLHRNEIRNIQKGTFDGMFHLSNLALDRNKLSTIRKDIFCNLPVVRLSLSNNLISTMEDSCFTNMSLLETLLLDNNLLTNFDARATMGNSERLQKLWLHNNLLTIVTRDTLHNMQNLRILNLSSNKIRTIETRTFESTPKLQLLALSNNEIKSLTSNVFAARGTIRIENLYLEANHLCHLSSSFLLRMPYLKRASIVGNPWSCGCLEIVHRWFNEAAVSQSCDRKLFDGKRPVCVMSGDNVYACDENCNDTVAEHFKSAYRGISVCQL